MSENDNIISLSPKITKTKIKRFSLKSENSDKFMR